MKRIAVFAEGQTELIFIRDFLLKVLDPSKISFECLELIAHQDSPVPYKYSSPSAEIHFLILNVRGDEGVLSSIKERERKLIQENGYERIIGLRDMYSEEYTKLSPGKIDDYVSNAITQRHNQIIEEMAHPERIKLYFAIMEIEAWFLGMYYLFQKIDSALTVDYIEKKLGINLVIIDPQKEFYRPEDQVNSILQLCGREYKKKWAEIESICSHIDSLDYDAARENARCVCFDDFYQEIVSYN